MSLAGSMLARRSVSCHGVVRNRRLLRARALVLGFGELLLQRALARRGRRLEVRVFGTQDVEVCGEPVRHDGGGVDAGARHRPPGRAVHVLALRLQDCTEVLEQVTAQVRVGLLEHGDLIAQGIPLRLHERKLPVQLQALARFESAGLL